MFGVTNFDLNQIQEMKTVILILSRFLWKKTNLTVSGQLEFETAAMGLGRVYTLGHTFRAEEF